jgi:hypothetical protein
MLRKNAEATSEAQEDVSLEPEHPKQQTVGSPQTSFSAAYSGKAAAHARGRD